MRPWRVCLVLSLCTAGCARNPAPTDLTSLARTLGCTLPADTQLLSSETAADATYWFVKSAARLPIEPGSAGAMLPVAREAIPRGVFTGIVAQLAPAQSGSVLTETTAGELREWTHTDGTWRVREFQTLQGWYSLVEHFRNTPD